MGSANLTRKESIMANNSNTSKRYSFFNAVNVAGKDNKPYLHLTTIGYVSNFKTRTIKDGYDQNNPNNGGHTIVVGRMPINRRTKTINRLFNSNFDEGEDQVWITVQAWDERAMRFQNMLTSYNNPKSLRIVLCGSFSLNTYAKNDGTEVKDLVLNVQDWSVISAVANDGGNNSGNTNPANTESAEASTPVSNAPSFDEDGFINGDAFEDVNADDLPF